MKETIFYGGNYYGILCRFNDWVAYRNCCAWNPRPGGPVQRLVLIKRIESERGLFLFRKIYSLYYGNKIITITEVKAMENINIKDTNNNVKIADRVPEKERKTEPTVEQREHWNQVWDESVQYGYYDYVHKEWRG